MSAVQHERSKARPISLLDQWADHASLFSNTGETASPLWPKFLTPPARVPLQASPFVDGEEFCTPSGPPARYWFFRYRIVHVDQIMRLPGEVSNRKARP